MDWLTLDDNEEVLWSGEPRMASIAPAIIIGIPLSVIGIGILIIVGAYLNIKNTDFVVTNEGLYKKTGVLSRSVQKIGFEKVQNISFSQGIIANYFGYGNVEISTAGGSGVEMRFNGIDDPKSVQERVATEMKKHTGKEKKEIEGEDTMELVLEELRETRKVLMRIEKKMGNE
jgi:uncharacterized membrane protein YdbT with pleckstrin-like domain